MTESSSPLKKAYYAASAAAGGAFLASVYWFHQHRRGDNKAARLRKSWAKFHPGPHHGHSLSARDGFEDVPLRHASPTALLSPHFVERVPFDPHKQPRGYHGPVHLTFSGGPFFMTQGHLLHRCLAFLSLEDLLRVARTCTSIRRATVHVLADRLYLKHICYAGLTPLERERGAWFFMLTQRFPGTVDAGTYGALMHSGAASDHSGPIRRDACRTLNHDARYEDSTRATAALERLLHAYSAADAPVGYVQGMNFVGGFLLSHMDEASAFATLRAMMLQEPTHLRTLYTHGLHRLRLAQYQLQRCLEWMLPTLARQLTRLGVQVEFFSTEWFLTIFSNRNMPLETCARIWDRFVVDGWKLLIRVALALLSLSQKVLLEQDGFEGIVLYLKALPPDLVSPDRVLACAQSFKVTNRLLHRLAQQHEALREE